jgi:glycerol uptake facilitator-like aquaporin
MRDVIQRNPALAAWERQRNKKEVHWIMECFSEMLGVFFYSYLGMGATAAFVTGNILKQTGLSSVLQIGISYACGIILALIVCFTTSGGHLSPGVTIAFCIFKGFPKLKAVRYIVAQILGALIAAALVYNQWKVLIEEAEVALASSLPASTFALTQFTPNGPPGIFAFYLLPGQTLARVFLNEFVNCTVLGIVIWATLDPTNYLIHPTMAPLIIGLAYGASIWGFGVAGLSLNSARDIGGRIFAVAIWGSKAAGGRYAAIAALTNIPAFVFAGYLYEVFLTDSDRVLAPAQMELHTYINGHGRTQPQADNNHTGRSSDEKADTSQTRV